MCSIALFILLFMRKENSNYKSLFLKKSTNIHHDFYNYSQIPDKFVYNTVISIICPHHGVFKQKACAHASGSGCQTCAKQLRENNVYTKNRHTLSDFVNKAQQMHGQRYDYSTTMYNGQMKKLTIICPTHGPFVCIANNHINGTGCPTCRKSRGETIIEQWLVKHCYQFECQKTFPNLQMNSTKQLRYDFFVPETNLLIEFDGKQHFEPVCFNGVDVDVAQILYELTVQSDGIKTQYAIDHNIQLLRISYKDIRNIDNILFNWFNSCTLTDF